MNKCTLSLSTHDAYITHSPNLHSIDEMSPLKFPFTFSDADSSWSQFFSEKSIMKAMVNVGGEEVYMPENYKVKFLKVTKTLKEGLISECG